MKSTDRLFEFVDPYSAEFVGKRKTVVKLYNERNISPDLLDRITAAWILELPGAGTALKEILAEGIEGRKAGRIEYAWIHLANWMKKVYEQAGWEWTPCRTGREKTLQDLHRVRKANAAAAAAEAEAEKIKETAYTGRVVRKKTDKGAPPDPDGLKTMAEALKALTSAAGAASVEAETTGGRKRKAKTA